MPVSRGDFLNPNQTVSKPDNMAPFTPALHIDAGTFAAIRTVDGNSGTTLPVDQTINAVVGNNLAQTASEATDPPITGVDIVAPVATEFALDYAGAVKAGLPVILVPAATEFSTDISLSADLSYVLEASGVVYTVTGAKAGEVQVTALAGATGQLSWTPTYKGIAFPKVSWTFTTVRDPAPVVAPTKQEFSLTLTAVSSTSRVKVTDSVVLHASSTFKFFCNTEFAQVGPTADGSIGLVLEWRYKNNQQWEPLGAAFTSATPSETTRYTSIEDVVGSKWTEQDIVYTSRGTVSNEQTLASGISPMEVALFVGLDADNYQQVAFYTPILIQEQ